MMPPLDLLRPDHMTVLPIVGWTLISILCWFLLYYACYLTARSSVFLLECFTCCLRALHAIIVVIFTLMAFRLRPHPFLDSGEQNIPLHNLVLVWSLGFFIFDCVITSLDKAEPVLMKVHHYGSVIVISTALIVQEGGAEIMVGLFLLESTNPLFQVRQILRLSKYKNGTFYKILELSFVSLFTLVRIFPCGITTLIVLVDPFANLHVQITYVTFYSISLLMVYFTLVYTIKKYFKKTKSF